MLSASLEEVEEFALRDSTKYPLGDEHGRPEDPGTVTKEGL